MAQTASSVSHQPPKRAHIGLADSQVEDLPVDTGGAEPFGAIQSAPTAVNDVGTSPARRRRGEFIFAPVPISREAIGIRVAPLAAYVSSHSASDRIRQPSILALAGVLTSAKTHGPDIFCRLNLKNDVYRLTFALGAERARYESFGGGEASGANGLTVPAQSIRPHTLFFQGLCRLKWRVSARLRFSQRQIRAGQEGMVKDIVPNAPLSLSIKDQFHQAITSAALGVRVQRDTRATLFYPIRGSRIPAQRCQFEANKHLPYGERQVFVLRGMGCGVVWDTVPFFEMCQFGWLGDLRAANPGRCRDRPRSTCVGHGLQQNRWRLAYEVSGCFLEEEYYVERNLWIVGLGNSPVNFQSCAGSRFGPAGFDW